MNKILKITKYLPKYYLRFKENIAFYFQKEKTYKDITKRSDEPSLYPIDFTYWVQSGHYDLKDDNGVPIRHHIDGKNIYSWSRVCNYTLYNYNEYIITQKQIYLDTFTNLVKFIENQLQIDEEKRICVLYHRYKWLEFDKPWIGGLTQGLMASVLMRYYLISKDAKYLKLTQMASNTFFLSVNNGGVAKYFNKNDEWLEEYPSIKTNKYSFVLNGFMVALIGLYETSTISKDNKYKLRYIELGKSLNNNLKYFLVEDNKWSLYSNPKLVKNYITPSYQSLHIVLLNFHATRLDNLYFKSIVNIWEEYFLNKSLRFKCFLKKLQHWINNPNTV